MKNSSSQAKESTFRCDISRRIWASKYRWEDHDAMVADTWRRVAAAIAEAERDRSEETATGFRRLLEDFRFLPGGRILAGAGTGRRVTLFNCFVMGPVRDSMDGIFEALKEGALTMQQGGGVGYDFSSLRPAGSLAKATSTVASGPVSFMAIWDTMCATLLSTGTRRGAMMATLRCDHPDIETFIDAKRDGASLTHFNLSVLVSDAFMAAVREDAEWPLVFPLEDSHSHGGADLEVVQRCWPGYVGEVNCYVARRVRARDLWDKIMRATYEAAEPGVLFVDRINAENNLWYRERLAATNPCGEVPLPPYGACNLGSFNLTRFVESPFGAGARFDFAAFAAAVPMAVRFLDNVIDLSGFPLPEQGRQARESRRLGLGISGLADALAMLGIRYDSEQARSMAREIMRGLCHEAYRASVDLAREKHPFPAFEAESYLRGRFIKRLPDDIRAAIARHGIRNSHLLAIAPTGTISLLANNVSGGIEPIYALQGSRRVVEADGRSSELPVVDYAWSLWQELNPGRQGRPDFFVRAAEISPADHLAMQAAIQDFVDNAISKTINVAPDYPFEEFRRLYEIAFDGGLKGCTTFRPNPHTGAVLTTDDAVDSDILSGSHCCNIDREAD